MHHTLFYSKKLLLICLLTTTLCFTNCVRILTGVKKPKLETNESILQKAKNKKISLDYFYVVKPIEPNQDKKEKEKKS